MMRKYPRTRHLEGSRLGPGDEDLEAAPFSQIAGRFLVVEEKLDGANAAISFDAEGLKLQSRGHYLAGGAREAQFAALKPWAAAHASAFEAVLGRRYVMYGEWLFAKHTIFYDALPHYFMEFDVLDRTTGDFLSTARRRELLGGLPVASVPVLAEKPFDRIEALTSLVGRALYKSPAWRENLREAAAARGVDVDRVVRETDPSDEAEGLYLKVEENGVVAGRFKWVRKTFLDSVAASGSHWHSRPIVANRLHDESAMFG